MGSLKIRAETPVISFKIRRGGDWLVETNQSSLLICFVPIL